MNWEHLPKEDIRRLVATICSRSSSYATFPSYEMFAEILNCGDCTAARSLYQDCQHVHLMYIGKWAGWWELSWDMFPDLECDLYPIQLKTVSLKETTFTNFASLLANLELFASGKDAKRNGWDKPLEKGDFFFKKKTYILRITE